MIAGRDPKSFGDLQQFQPLQMQQTMFTFSSIIDYASYPTPKTKKKYIFGFPTHAGSQNINILRKFMKESVLF